MEPLQWGRGTKEIILSVDVAEENRLIQIKRSAPIVALERARRSGNIPGLIKLRENGRFKGSC
jgi:hypothetical protein